MMQAYVEWRNFTSRGANLYGVAMTGLGGGVIELVPGGGNIT